MINSRDIILDRISESLNTEEINIENYFSNKDLFLNNNETLELTFAQEFTKNNGKFIFCENLDELKSNLKLLVKEKKWDSIFAIDNDIQKILESCSIAYESVDDNLFEITSTATNCEYLIARTGSIMVSSNSKSGRILNICPDAHIVIAHISQIIYDIEDAIESLKNKYQNLPSHTAIITGPSRTADIEKTLVLGAHGPKELYLFLYN